MTTATRHDTDAEVFYEEADALDDALESTRDAARAAVLKMATQPGGVTLGEARRNASTNPHASARAIVRLVSTGRLTLTGDQRLVPGPELPQ